MAELDNRLRRARGWVPAASRAGLASESVPARGDWLLHSAYLLARNQWRNRSTPHP